jgi:hypothetical protein
MMDNTNLNATIEGSPGTAPMTVIDWLSRGMI